MVVVLRNQASLKTGVVSNTSGGQFWLNWLMTCVFGVIFTQVKGGKFT